MVDTADTTLFDIWTQSMTLYNVCFYNECYTLFPSTSQFSLK